MSKTAGFPHDAYKFIISGIRDADSDGVLERLMGGPQEQFELTYGRIQELGQLADAAGIREDLLDYLLALVGWDGSDGQGFIDSLGGPAKRKLVKLSASLWKGKGRPDNLVDAIRVFTGKSALLHDYFYSRLLIDVAATMRGGWRGQDAWVTGGTFTDLDEFLVYMTINRSGLTDADKALIYSLLGYVRPALEHVSVIYAAFVDDFSSGETARWTSTGAVASYVNDSRELVMPPDSELETVVSATELATWTWYTRIFAGLRFYTADPLERVTLQLMRQAAGPSYGAQLRADGTVTLFYNGSSVTSRALTLPTVSPSPGHPVGFEIGVEPRSQGVVDVIVWVGGYEVIREAFTGDEALVTNELPPLMTGPNVAALNPVLVDNVIALAPPFHFQAVGQIALGVSGVADPDPGPIALTATPEPPTAPPTVIADSAGNLGTWVLGGSGWHVSTFAALHPEGALWWGNPSTGRWPLQTVDPDYVGAAGGSAESPVADLSAFSAGTFSARVRARYHLPLVTATGDPDVVWSLRYRIGAGSWVALGTVGAGATSGCSDLTPPDLGDPRVGGGVDWWTEEEWALPDAVLGEPVVRIRFVATVGGVYTATDFGFALGQATVYIERN